MHHTSIIADKKSHLIFSILKTNLDVCLVGLFVLMIDSNAIGQWFNVRSKRMNSNINTKWILRLCIFSSITLSLLCVWFPFRMKCIFFVAIFFFLWCLPFLICSNTHRLTKVWYATTTKSVSTIRQKETKKAVRYFENEIFVQFINRRCHLFVFPFHKRRWF